MARRPARGGWSPRSARCCGAAAVAVALACRAVSRGCFAWGEPSPFACGPARWTAGAAARRAPERCDRGGRRLPVAAAAQEDTGYNLLFETAPEEFEDHCVAVSRGAFPAYAKGDFVMPSVGQFEMGDRKFVGFLDCFGKMQRFAIDGGRVCATYRMMETGFFNQSSREGTIGPGLLFFETQPPRQNPWYLGPVANMPPFAPNDNTYVNTVRVGETLLSVTDSYTWMRIDPLSMRVTGEQVFQDDLKGLVCYTGSAHPLRDPGTGDVVNFIGNADLFSGATTVRLFRLCEEAPSVRRSISDVAMDTAPYMHSFGVTPNYVVLPRQPVKFSATEVAMKPMSAAFQPVDLAEEGPQNAFHVVPLNGSRGFVRTLPVDEPLWYVHTVNAYENATGVVIDLTTLPENPFAGDLTLEASRSKEIRDQAAKGEKGLVKRFLLPWRSDEPVTTEILSDLHAATDFPCINPRYQSRKHCVYWAVEWFADSESYASMAIVRHDVCTGAKKLAWSRKNWYPSEATMVPSDREGAEEDEGVLLFTALDGESGQTFLLGVDARTMEVVAEAGPFPRIAFTTHGQFYPGSP